jgi:hypothetical protein
MSFAFPRHSSLCHRQRRIQEGVAGFFPQVPNTATSICRPEALYLLKKFPEMHI